MNATKNKAELEGANKNIIKKTSKNAPQNI